MQNLGKCYLKIIQINFTKIKWKIIIIELFVVEKYYKIIVKFRIFLQIALFNYFLQKSSKIKQKMKLSFKFKIFNLISKFCLLINMLKLNQKVQIVVRLLENINCNSVLIFLKVLWKMKIFYLRDFYFITTFLTEMRMFIQQKMIHFIKEKQIF